MLSTPYLGGPISRPICFLLQIFRSLAIPMSTQMLSEITSRLLEVVSEPGEDMQGFVTDILQTIEKAVPTLELNKLGQSWPTVQHEVSGFFIFIRSNYVQGQRRPIFETSMIAIVATKPQKSCRF